jgi:GTP-binding protein Era
LVNALVGSKVTIVSRKVQTTRALIRGIVVEDNAQIILVDTPGIFAPKRRLDRAMVSTAWSGAHDADLVCVLLDARAGIDEEADAILTKLETVAHPKILVINKIDLVPREKLLALAKAANERLTFTDTFMVAALSGDGVDDLRHALAAKVPAGPFHYPEDQMSDAPLRYLAAEITREKIYRHLHQELPYQSTVETDTWTERKDHSIKIEQTIFVERDSQRKIVLGKGGATIKSIGEQSRKEIAEIVGQPVHLFLFVKVRDGWGDDPERYREMGLDFPKE